MRDRLPYATCFLYPCNYDFQVSESHKTLIMLDETEFENWHGTCIIFDSWVLGLES